MERVTFSTEDGVEIVGDYYPVTSAKAALLLLHMMPSDRTSWRTFSVQASAAGFVVLAIDLRGHGESLSRQGEKMDYRQFSDLEQQQKILDVSAAVSFLYSKIGKLPLILFGASIGANLALKYAAEHPDVLGVALLSAGIDYRGVQTIPPARNMQGSQSVYVIAAKDDTRSGGPANQQAREIYDAISCKKHIKIFDTGGHGTDMLNAHPEFSDQLINWIGSIL